MQDIKKEAEIIYTDVISILNSHEDFSIIGIIVALIGVIDQLVDSHDVTDKEMRIIKDMLQHIICKYDVGDLK